jgi:hypothetical protein
MLSMVFRNSTGAIYQKKQKAPYGYFWLAEEVLDKKYGQRTIDHRSNQWNVWHLPWVDFSIFGHEQKNVPLHGCVP